MATRQMTLRIASASVVMFACFSANAIAQDKPSGAELPKAAEIPNVTPDVLLRTDVPNVPGKVIIFSRTTYNPGAHVAKHYHTSQIIFYILQGSMGVKDDGKDPITLKTGDSLLIKPGTVHEHWNMSSCVSRIYG